MKAACRPFLTWESMWLSGVCSKGLYPESLNDMTAKMERPYPEMFWIGANYCFE
jgi:hypothetical protein